MLTKTLSAFMARANYSTEQVDTIELDPIDGTQTVQEVDLMFTKRITVQDIRIRSSQEAHSVLRAIFDPHKIAVREEFVALFLDKSNHVTGFYQGFVGGITGVVVDPRLIFSVALKCLAVAIVLAHNHPSGNLTPSIEDKKLTQKVKEGGEFLDIHLLDHIIINSRGEYLSFADKKML